MAKGYTKLDNDYFLRLSTFNLKGSEFKVLLFLLRQSICYKRDYTKECSASFIAAAVGLSERQVKRALKCLLDNKYIYLDISHSSKKGHSWYIASDKLGFLRGQTWSVCGDKYDTDNIPSLSHKEITVDNSKIKEKEKANASFSSISETENEVTEEEREAWWNSLGEDEENV